MGLAGQFLRILRQGREENEQYCDAGWVIRFWLKVAFDERQFLAAFGRFLPVMATKRDGQIRCK
jgi:hypothetical protein